MQCIVVAIVPFAIVLSRVGKIRSPRRWVVVPLLGSGLYLFACSLPVLASTAGDAKANLAALRDPQRPGSFRQTCHPPSGMERARCMIVDPEMTAAVEYVEQRTTPDDRIYVGAGRHDKLL